MVSSVDSETIHGPNIYTAFLRAAKQFQGRVAIRDGDLRYSFGDVVEQSRRAARALIASGIEKGDRVAIWAVNHADWVIGALAIQAAGAILIPLSTRLRGLEVGGILTRANVRAVMCDRGFASYDFVAALVERDLPDLELIVAFGADGIDCADPRVTGWSGLLARASGCSDEDLDGRIAATGLDDIVDILFTSGTTGMPKGVPMTHAQSLIACHQQHVDICHFRPGDVFPVIFPFAHNAGYRAGWQVSLLYGVTVVPMRVTDPLEILQLLDAVKPTYFPAAPPIFRAILDHPRRTEFDLSSIRLIATGGTDVPIQLIRDMRRELDVQHIVSAYGLTEVAGSATSGREGDPDDVVALTAGTPLSNLDVICVDAEHRPVPVGTAGEIAIRGPQVLKGYFNDPEATARAFTADGYFLTGDVGKFDAGGNLIVTDRIKDMYLVGGFNCYPAEIEQIMRGHPGIADIAVVGIADDRLGQVGRAFIVPRADAPSESDIVAWCRLNMANYKVPRSVIMLDALPRNPQGKVEKARLREWRPETG